MCGSLRTDEHRLGSALRKAHGALDFAVLQRVLHIKVGLAVEEREEFTEERVNTAALARHLHEQLIELAICHGHEGRSGHGCFFFSFTEYFLLTDDSGLCVGRNGTGVYTLVFAGGRASG